MALTLIFGISISGDLSNAQGSKSGGAKIFAQKLVEDTVAAHSEISGIELATTPPNQSQCVTIASTEAKDIGEKCDKDEFTAMKTNKPFVEKEKENGKEVYDITMPIHDSEGKIIGTAGMDFKPEPGQQESRVLERARHIARELERQILSKDKLFEPAERPESEALIRSYAKCG